MKFEENPRIFIQENAFESVVLFRSQCEKLYSKPEILALNMFLKVFVWKTFGKIYEKLTSYDF